MIISEEEISPGIALVFEAAIKDDVYPSAKFGSEKDLRRDSRYLFGPIFFFFSLLNLTQIQFNYHDQPTFRG